MYVRLAFAVAAHLEPEILIIDEVLAVGDLTFQNKCLGKMKEFGTTFHRLDPSIDAGPILFENRFSIPALYHIGAFTFTHGQSPWNSALRAY